MSDADPPHIDRPSSDPSTAGAHASTRAVPDVTAPRGASALVEVALVFLRLGCLSFGGPVAHLGYFRTELVEKRRWLDDAHYADIVALCQFLPGPASSQVVFALGMRRAGLVGALAASLAFTMPSALLLIAFAFGVSVLDTNGAGWLAGLKLAAVAVVAQAVWGMGKKLCPDRARLSLAVCSAATLLVVSGALAQVAVIVAGGLAGFALYRDSAGVGAASGGEQSARAQRLGALALVVFFALLVVLPAMSRVTGAHEVRVFDAFYRSGALVFGGGHVVLPLLRAEVVPPGWITDDQFLAGYGAAQAVPGPLFTFAAYLGAAMGGGAPSAIFGLFTLFAIFLPAWLVVGGALPFWERLRTTRAAQAALMGANASVVGVLLAALYAPVVTESVHAPRDVAIVFVAFLLLEIWRRPPWLVVVGCAAVGHWLLGL